MQPEGSAESEQPLMDPVNERRLGLVTFQWRPRRLRFISNPVQNMHHCLSCHTCLFFSYKTQFRLATDLSHDSATSGGEGELQLHPANGQ